MDLNNVFSFLGFAALLAIMPGPDNIFVLTQSLSKGWKTGVYITLGLSSGVLVHTTAAATGVSVVLYSYAPAFMAVKLIGAAYLLYLAYQATKEKPMGMNENEHDPAYGLNFIGLIKRGFLMNVLNPKVSLFFVALLPQFVQANGIAPFYQMIILGLLFMFESFLIFSAIAIIGGRFAEVLNQNRFWLATKWVKISVFVLLALKLALATK